MSAVGAALGQTKAARVRCCSNEANDGDAAAPRTPKRRWHLTAQEGLWE